MGSILQIYLYRKLVMYVHCTVQYVKMLQNKQNVIFLQQWMFLNYNHFVKNSTVLYYCISRGRGKNKFFSTVYPPPLVKLHFSSSNTLFNPTSYYQYRYPLKEQPEVTIQNVSDSAVSNKTPLVSITTQSRTRQCKWHNGVWLSVELDSTMSLTPRS